MFIGFLCLLEYRKTFKLIIKTVLIYAMGEIQRSNEIQDTDISTCHYSS